MLHDIIYNYIKEHPTAKMIKYAFTVLITDGHGVRWVRSVCARLCVRREMPHWHQIYFIYYRMNRMNRVEIKNNNRQLCAFVNIVRKMNEMIVFHAPPRLSGKCLANPGDTRFNPICIQDPKRKTRGLTIIFIKFSTA